MTHLLSPSALSVPQEQAALLEMRGENIICFAKDWSEDPTSCNHVLRGLARYNRVLWLNSISTRVPRLSSKRDIGKIKQKLIAFAHGPQKMEDNLWVYTPLVLPLHHHPGAVLLNRWIIRLTFALLRKRLGMRAFQLWSFVPTASLYAENLGQDLLVYYCVDNWSAFSAMNRAQTDRMTERLTRQADVVFATSRPLVEKLSAFNPKTVLASHGVAYDLFRTALEERTVVPDDLARLPQPVLGFYGLIEDWLDQDLIAFLARRHPEWSIALIGRACVDTSRLTSLPNVHLLGRKPHGELPAYCKGLAVGLIPHQVNELTLHMNPIKLREYLCAGLPIVSTALPEMRRYPNDCIAADSYEGFEQGIADFLRSETPQKRRARSLSMQGETWEKKLQLLEEEVLKAKKSPRR